jgi:hypothetical protein
MTQSVSVSFLSWPPYQRRRGSSRYLRCLLIGIRLGIVVPGNQEIRIARQLSRLTWALFLMKAGDAGNPRRFNAIKCAAHSQSTHISFSSHPQPLPRDHATNYLHMLSTGLCLASSKILTPQGPHPPMKTPDIELACYSIIISTDMYIYGPRYITLDIVELACGATDVCVNN